MIGDSFIELAGHLIVNTAFQNAEARYRSAVSRAYYGAFHLTVAYLQTHCGYTIKENAEGHKDAYRVLWNTKVTPAKNLARKLDDLRTDRNSADYKLLDKKWEKEDNARYRVEIASQIRQCVADCSVEPLKSQIASAIQNAKP